MQRTSWKKCDLQVATPAWRFTQPAGSTYDFAKQEDRQDFLDQYMQSLQAKGIEVIALADHNTGDWIDAAKAAGARHGVTVFPGCEITTTSGADGVHLIIIGDLDKSTQDFDRLLHSQLGFANSPLFGDNGGHLEPLASALTVEQTLDGLPDGYIAIAPHVFNDNGLASKSTVKGDIRWRCLHHPKLSAVDPGDCSDIEGETFNARFRRRQLDDFPCLQHLAFVATSDAYSLEQLGQRFTWIRMGTPSLEALRQAFLDYEARVLCDWAPRLAEFPDRDPNKVRHAWIASVDLAGTLGNSDESLSIPLHPNLNVIIGGRGSGKSTVVAALRQLYGWDIKLPDRIQKEADVFADNVFAAAELRADHHLQESQQEQTVTWAQHDGSRVVGTESPPDFPVRIISQKELFERAAGDKRDPFLASRNLLAMLDHSIGFGSLESQSIGGLARRIEDAKAAWATAVRSHVELAADLEQLPRLRDKAQTLQGQVEAFTAPEVRARLAKIGSVRRDAQLLREEEQHLVNLVNSVESLLQEEAAPATSLQIDETRQEAFNAALASLRTVADAVTQSLRVAAETGRDGYESWKQGPEFQSWETVVGEAKVDLADYTTGLADKGLSRNEFTRLQEELTQVRQTIRILTEKEGQLAQTATSVSDSWCELLQLLAELRSERNRILQSVQERSGLRFVTQPFKDRVAWKDAIRELAGFRSDAYLDDVPGLADWLWNRPDEETEARWLVWRDALATGQIKPLSDAARLKSGFATRLAGLDEVIRLRLATEIPEDVVTMQFLRPGGDATKSEDWQSIIDGSPGQRTAAMLAFVLHHGNEPLVVDQPEDDLDSEWISNLVVGALRDSRWHRQLIVVTHNANVPVLGDADQVIALENRNGTLRIRSTDGSPITPHVGPVEFDNIRVDIQSIMEGGIDAFVRRERRYNTQGRKH